MLSGMRPPCDQTGFIAPPRPTGWVQDDGRWGLWRNGLEIAAVQPDAKGVRVRLSCRKLWRDKEVRAASFAPGEVLCRAMVCRPGSGGCAAEGGCGATGRQRRTSPQALQHRDPAAETTGRDPQPEAVAVPVSRRCLRIGACDRRRRQWLHGSEEHGQGALGAREGGLAMAAVRRLGRESQRQLAGEGNSEAGRRSTADCGLSVRIDRRQAGPRVGRGGSLDPPSIGIGISQG